MQNQKSYQKAGFLIILTALSVYFCNSITGLVNPAIASLAAAYPDTPLSTIMLVSTIPMLLAVPTNFAAGPLVKKFGLKKILTFGLFIFVISGVAPFAMRNSFTLILVTRVFNGLGYGLMSPAAPMVVNAYIEPERRSSILGLGQSVTQGFGIFLALTVGVIASHTVYNIWLLNLIMCIPLVLGLMLPKEPEWGAEAPAEAAIEDVPAADSKKNSIPVIGWVVIVLAFLWFVFSYPHFLYLSSIIESNGVGDAATSGLAQTMFSVGGVLSGLLFGKLYGSLKKFIVPFGLACLVLNYLILALTASLPLYFVAQVIGGLGYSTIYVGFITCLTINCAPDVFPTAVGIMMAFANIGGFISSFVINAILSVFGMAASVTFPLLICGIILGAFCVILCVKPLKM